MTLSLLPFMYLHPHDLFRRIVRRLHKSSGHIFVVLPRDAFPRCSPHAASLSLSFSCSISFSLTSYNRVAIVLFSSKTTTTRGAKLHGLGGIGSLCGGGVENDIQLLGP